MPLRVLFVNHVELFKFIGSDAVALPSTSRVFTTTLFPKRSEHSRNSIPISCFITKNVVSRKIPIINFSLGPCRIKYIIENFTKYISIWIFLVSHQHFQQSITVFFPFCGPVVVCSIVNLALNPLNHSDAPAKNSTFHELNQIPFPRGMSCSDLQLGKNNVTSRFVSSLKSKFKK